MSGQRANPSPLAGEGAARRRRGAGEGALTLTKAARELRSRTTGAERKLWFALKDRSFSPVISLAIDAALSRKERGEERDRAMSPVPKLMGAQ